MKINLILLLLFVALGLGWTLYHDQKQLSEASLTVAPAFTYQTINGKKAALKDHRGDVTLIHFWATWCAPCLVELPSLIDFAASQKNVTVLAIAVKDQPDTIERFFKKIKKPASNDLVPENFVIGLDPDQHISKTLYGAVKLPESFLLTPEHKISRKLVGAQENWNNDLWKKKVELLRKSE